MINQIDGGGTVEATAALPKATAAVTTKDAVKIATPDLIIFNDDVMSIEIMTDLIFENIGGHELINIARNDMLNGQDVIYNPIKNLTSLYLKYNPQNILALQDTSDAYFKNFPIKFENKIPEFGSGPNNETVYLEPNSGNIIINVINLEKDEQVEVQILNNGTILNGTIYEVE
jgi:hypothetical protein